MTVLSAYKFVQHHLRRKVTPSKSTEDDKKLQTELHVLLSNLEKKKKKKNLDEHRLSLQEALYNLVEKIQQATVHTLDTQIVSPGAELQRQLDVASLGVLVDRMNKSRMVDQEWVSDSEQLKRDITELVAKSACFFPNDQRYQLSPSKERDLYLFQVFAKIDRLNSRRMTNQDARHQDEEMYGLIHKMQEQSNKFAEQRATIRPTDPLT